MDNIKLRNGHNRPTSPLSAIKEFCLECCGYNSAEVRSCVDEHCPLYMMRTGVNKSKPKRQMTEEQRQTAKERLQKAREAKNH